MFLFVCPWYLPWKPNECCMLSVLARMIDRGRERSRNEECPKTSPEGGSATYIQKSLTRIPLYVLSAVYETASISIRPVYFYARTVFCSRKQSSARKFGYFTKIITNFCCWPRSGSRSVAEGPGQWTEFPRAPQRKTGIVVGYAKLHQPPP